MHFGRTISISDWEDGNSIHVVVPVSVSSQSARHRSSEFSTTARSSLLFLAGSCALLLIITFSHQGASNDTLVTTKLNMAGGEKWYIWYFY